MKKRPFTVLLLASFAWVAIACTSSRMLSSTAQLEQAEQKWVAQDITSYRIEVLVVNSIWHAQSHQILVQNMTVAQATARCVPASIETGSCEVRPYTAEDYTVLGLFTQARSQVQSQPAEWITITYDDATYGFPSQISFDNPDIVDEDWTWRVTIFEVYP